MCFRVVFAVLVALTVVGCRFGQLPDPNKRVSDSKYDGETLQKNVRQVDELLTERLVKGEIGADEKSELLKDYIATQVKDVDLRAIPELQLWRFADVYRQMGDWKVTNDLYERAVKSAKDEDRRVNDTLRLAEAKSRLGDVGAGIQLVRSTFDVAPTGKAPILLATLYEFVPASLGKGHDVEVAQLLEDAMAQHLLTVVDPTTDSGQAFIQSRQHHIQSAWEIVIRIHRMQGDNEAFRDAIERSDLMLRRFAVA